MASMIYDAFLDNLVKGGINFATDTFKVILVKSTYDPSASKGTHDNYTNVTGGSFEVTGTNYNAGGLATTPTCTKDTALHREDITFTNVTWSTSTITARACIIYKVGSDAAHSWLIAYVDFGQDVSSTAAAFSVTFSSALRFQN